MSHLFYTSTAVYRSFLVILDEAEACIRSGGKPIFLACDGTLTRYCFHNVSGKKATCRLCRFMRKEGLKALSQPVQQYFIHDLLQEEDVQRINAMRFNYQSIDDIYAVTYKDVDIGYAALSHYICCTRNYEPALTPELRTVIDGFLRTSVFLTDAIERLIHKHPLTSVSLYNGRTFDTRPVLRKCVAAGIKANVFEVIGCGEIVEKVCFPNSLPHNVAMQGHWIEEQWQKAVAVNEQDAVQIGHSFFQKRRDGIRAGDRVYTTKQQPDKLPKDWDSTKKNIVFFSSSEDEFVAIDDEWETNKYAPTQIEGIRKILAATLDKKDSIHVYVRIHPNLAGVTFSYHTDLYTLERDYPNVTVIPPESQVSSYALIDHADKVVVFGSTVGIEAVYWGKPVILMGPAYYQNLGVCYIPKNDDDLKQLLISELAPMSQAAAIKYGYSIMGNVGIPFKCFDFSLFWPDFFLSKLITNEKQRALFLSRSIKIIQLLLSFIRKLCGRFSTKTLQKTTAHASRCPAHQK